MGVVDKRSSMTFYSAADDHYSHRVRIVLAEKGVTVDIVDTDPANPSEELAEFNPYNSIPTLVDRELVLYESKIMMEYLDERFPHPPLLPVYPVARAESRLYMYRIERDWCSLANQILKGGTARSLEKPRKELREGLLAVAPIFEERPYFMSEEFTLVDCCLAPLLWRMQIMGIELPEDRKSTRRLENMDRQLSRPRFEDSLTQMGRERYTTRQARRAV